MSNENELDLKDLTQKVLKREIDYEQLSSEQIREISEIIQNEIEKMDDKIVKVKENIYRIKNKLKK